MEITVSQLATIGVIRGKLECVSQQGVKYDVVLVIKSDGSGEIVAVHETAMGMSGSSTLVSFDNGDQIDNALVQAITAVDNMIQQWFAFTSEFSEWSKQFQDDSADVE